MSATDIDESVLNRLRERIGESTVERLVELARNNVRERQAAALEASNRKDWRALAEAVHSIRGSAQLLGARRLEQAAAFWEAQAGSGAMESAEEALDEISGAFAAVETVLEAAGAG